METISQIYFGLGTGKRASVHLSTRLDANQYLVHSSEKSSEMMNIYTGNVTTDELGLATIKLPAWFEAETLISYINSPQLGATLMHGLAEGPKGPVQIATNATKVEASWQSPQFARTLTPGLTYWSSKWSSPLVNAVIICTPNSTVNRRRSRQNGDAI